jgi:hypothetical protein
MGASKRMVVVRQRGHNQFRVKKLPKGRQNQCQGKQNQGQGRQDDQAGRMIRQAGKKPRIRQGSKPGGLSKRE